MNTTILLLDDDVALCNSISELLTAHGFHIIVCHKSSEAREKIKNNRVDVILLDLILPGDIDGITLCKSLRQMTQAPIMMLTGVAEDAEQIISLEIGADYYLTKPFNSRVLIAQIHALLRRYRTSTETAVDSQYQVYEFSGWKLNVTTRMLLSIDNRPVNISVAEFKLLQTMLEHAQRVLTREQLLELTNTNSTAFDRSIDILMSRLRSKIEKGRTHSKIFTTVRNSGYLLSCKVMQKTISSETWEALLHEGNDKDISHGKSPE